MHVDTETQPYSSRVATESPSVDLGRDGQAAIGPSCRSAAGRDARIAAFVAEFQSLIPPVWPLQDYIAVNPFMGRTDVSLLAARSALRDVRNCELLMPLEYFRSEFARGALQPDDISSAFAECVRDNPDELTGLDVQSVVAALNGEDVCPIDRSWPLTIADLLDARRGSEWASHIVNDISRYCAAHFDEGQASWPTPQSARLLFDAWRSSAQHSRRMDWLGIPGFRKLVGGLPDTSISTIACLLEEMQIPESIERTYLLRLLNSVPGWASYTAYQAWDPASTSGLNEDLAGLLAIRLTYDAALAKANTAEIASLGPLLEPLDTQDEESRHAKIRYVLQVATELAYRRRLCTTLRGAPKPVTAGRKAAQLVFCIDVRSEVLRRHLESESELLETFGFAGFFGIPMEYRAWGTGQRTAQCPALLRPSLRVSETLSEVNFGREALWEQRQRALQLRHRIWRGFQSSAISCFSFVESMGLWSVGKLLRDALGFSRRAGHDAAVPRACADRTQPALSHSGYECVSFATQVQLAEGILRNLGLMNNLSRTVVLCGHEAEVVNNPYRAALDCGACGGHSGEPNARVAALLLNRPEVRRALTQHGLLIPDDTLFVAAVHNTTTDDVRFCDPHLLPASHQADLQQLRVWLDNAATRSRAERSTRLGATGGQALRRRARDWSEVRPEWGLAGNAAFLIAPRDCTRMLNLEGRTFLHSYDHRQDPDLRVLELILTAPMVVTNWINLQYYASTVDNRSFGSGTKTIHNVVGQFGVLQGNGGDLMTGLPWQSVHDGQEFRHQPLRLLVMIAAPRDSIEAILRRHPRIRELATNRWVSVVAWEGDDYFRWTGRGEWEPCSERASTFTGGT